MKQIAILGSTGSIGRSTQKVVLAHPNRSRVVSLAAGSNWSVAKEQIEILDPDFVAMADGNAADELRKLFPHKTIESGPEAVRTAATLEEVDTVVAAVVGEAGLAPTYAAASAGKIIALANKEALVMAGPLFLHTKATLLPVDSEHAALHQAIRGGSEAEVRRLILTASGGPFRERPVETFGSITMEEALAHPTWKMGPKITIDSATMVNKALEVIEAHFLFGVEPEFINVLIHPQSLIHSMVEYVDGTILAQLSPNDMVFPIQYALTYPRRIPCHAGYLDLERIRTLEFATPEPRRYPALSLAYESLKAGESAPAVLSAANEEGVQAFLDGRLSFTAITDLLRRVLDRHEPQGLSTLEDVLSIAEWARRAARSEIISLT